MLYSVISDRKKLSGKAINQERGDFYFGAGVTDVKSAFTPMINFKERRK